MPRIIPTTTYTTRVIPATEYVTPRSQETDFRFDSNLITFDSIVIRFDEESTKPRFSAIASTRKARYLKDFSWNIVTDVDGNLVSWVSGPLSSSASTIYT